MENKGGLERGWKYQHLPEEYSSKIQDLGAQIAEKPPSKGPWAERMLFGSTAWRQSIKRDLQEHNPVNFSNYASFIQISLQTTPCPQLIYFLDCLQMDKNIPRTRSATSKDHDRCNGSPSSSESETAGKATSTQSILPSPTTRPGHRGSGTSLTPPQPPSPPSPSPPTLNPRPGNASTLLTLPRPLLPSPAHTRQHNSVSPEGAGPASPHSCTDGELGSDCGAGDEGCSDATGDSPAVIFLGSNEASNRRPSPTAIQKPNRPSRSTRKWLEIWDKTGQSSSDDDLNLSGSEGEGEEKGEGGKGQTRKAKTTIKEVTLQ